MATLTAAHTTALRAAILCVTSATECMLAVFAAIAIDSFDAASDSSETASEARKLMLLLART